MKLLIDVTGKSCCQSLGVLARHSSTAVNVWRSTEPAKALLPADVLPWGEEVLHAALLIKESAVHCSCLATTTVTLPTWSYYTLWKEGGRAVELAEEKCPNVAVLATAL